MPKAKKQTNTELIITEKPQAAGKIADALGKSSKKTVQGVTYYEINDKKSGKTIIFKSLLKSCIEFINFFIFLA